MVRLGRALSAFVLLGGCADILGFSGSDNLVECNSDADCKPGFVCDAASSCRCERDCGVSGTGGMSANAGASSGESGTSGTGVGEGGENGGARVGGKGGASAVGGEAGTPGGAGDAGEAPAKGGTAGVPHFVGGAGDNGDGGAQGGAGAGGAPPCDATHQDCVLVCGDESIGSACPTCAADDACRVPPSCSSTTAKCSADLLSCCLSYPVPGGDFLRSCDLTCQLQCLDAEETPTFPAFVSPFSLDVFEVTVGRFRAFVDAYPASKPKVGAGANAHGKEGLGWDPAWDTALPTTKQDLIDELASRVFCPGAASWTPQVSSEDDRPMNCVTWFEAAAFCIWDGGRLPTEAEWNFAAAGGGEQRYYPWSKPPEDDTIDDEHAVYTADFENPRSGPEVVGSHPAGRARWLQHDMGGNLTEWVWDALADCYTNPDCRDCGSATENLDRIARGGGFLSDPGSLSLDSRDRSTAPTAREDVGFRCARNR